MIINMEYTLISDEQKKELDDFLILKDNEVDLKLIQEHPSYFMKHMLGKKPFTYQHMVFDALVKGNRRICICSARQIGKSLMCATIALWSALFNKFPSGIYGNTKVCIISRSDKQAQKLMSEIRKLVKMGDRFIALAWKKEGYISSQLQSIYEGGTQNKEEMVFINGSTIKSFPATDAILGESADIIIIDEAAFVEDNIYLDNIKPTISHTGGSVILSSTPRGMMGFFYDIFDTFEKRTQHEFTRFWFPWWLCESQKQLDIIQSEKDISKTTGKYKNFQQEYEALFTVETTAFLDSRKIDDCINYNISQVYEWEEECCLGIDYGLTMCHTVLTISGKVGNKTRLLYQHSYPFDENYDLISDVTELKQRFNIAKIIADNGSPGAETNKAMIRLGWNVQCFDFRSFQARMYEDMSRNRGYYALRAAINNGLIEIPYIPELIAELKNLQEVPMKVNVAIEKPKGGYDDRSDSMMLSMIPYITDSEGNFDFTLVDSSNKMVPNSKMNNPRYDEMQEYMKIRMEEMNTWLNPIDKKR